MDDAKIVRQLSIDGKDYYLVEISLTHTGTNDKMVCYQLVKVVFDTPVHYRSPRGKT